MRFQTIKCTLGCLLFVYFLKVARYLSESHILFHLETNYCNNSGTILVNVRPLGCCRTTAVVITAFNFSFFFFRINNVEWVGRCGCHLCNMTLLPRTPSVSSPLNSIYDNILSATYILSFQDVKMMRNINIPTVCQMAKVI